MSNEDVFKRAVTRVQDVFMSKALEEAKGKQAEIQIRMDQLTNEFYHQTFVTLLGLKSGSFASYSSGYQRFKRNVGKAGAGFYELSGTLKKEMVTRSAAADFGRAKVRFGKGGAGPLNAGVKLDATGRPQYQHHTGGRAGLVKIADAFAGAIGFNIMVELFPLIKTKASYKVFDIYPNDETTVTLDYRSNRMRKKRQQTTKITRRQAGLQTKLRRMELGGGGQARRSLLLYSIEFHRNQYVKAELAKLNMKAW